MSIVFLSKHNIERASSTLYLAFRNDPLLLWMFDGQDNYDRKALWAIKSWIKWCILYGIAIATPDFEAVAIAKKPGIHNFSLWSVIRSGMWRAPSLLGANIHNRIMTIDKLINAEQLKNMGSDQFWYLWLIGTHPSFRQRGYAKILMNDILELSRDSKLPCYLETATKSNVTIYHNLGFEKLSTINIPDSADEIYCMATN